MFGALGRFEVGATQLDTIWSRNQRLGGFALLPLLTAEGMRQDLARLFALHAHGKLRVHIGGSFFPLDRVTAAHGALDSRSTMGKFVLQLMTA